MVDCTRVDDLPADVESIWLLSNATGIEKLSRFTRLKRIRSNLSEELLPVLADLPHLQHAEFSLPRREIPSLSCLKKLRTLVLRCNCHQSTLEYVRDMTWLHSLCLSEAVGAPSLDPLSTLSELRELYLDGKLRSRHTVDSLAPLSALRHLEFAVLLLRVAKPNRTLAPLCSLKKLKTLWLSPDYRPEEYDMVLKAAPGLTQIRFPGGPHWPPDAAD